MRMIDAKNENFLKNICNVKFSLFIILIIVLLQTSSAQDGPYFHQIYSAISTDGINWTFIDFLLFDHTSVPGAVFFNKQDLSLRKKMEEK